MTRESKFRDRVRARMARTNEAYTTAKRNLEAEDRKPPVDAEPVPAASGTGEAQALSAYQQSRREFREESLDGWRALVERLIGNETAKTWESLPDIVDVLREVGEQAPLNHLFFPDGGGLDLMGAEPSHEPGCLELNLDGMTTIVRPRTLTLVQPAGDPTREWSYLLLDTGELAPSGVYEDVADEHSEPVVELEPGTYVGREHWDSGIYGYDEDGDPQPLPEGARLLRRYFRGPILIMAKASGYNTLDRYIGFHAKWSPEQFRDALEQLIQQLHRDGRYGKDLKPGAARTS